MKTATFVKWNKELRFFIGNCEQFIYCPTLKLAKEIASKYGNSLVII